MKKRSYRAKEIKTAVVSEIIKNREGWSGAIGIDVGKDELFVMLRWEDGSFVGPWRAENTAGIQSVVELLVPLSQCRKLIVALEPTGTYGDVLRYALTQAGLNVHQVKGKASHDYAEIMDGVPSQHDRKDAAVVAELAGTGKSRPWPYDEESPENQERMYWVERIESAQKTMQVWTGRLESRVARHWPEVTKLLPLNSVSLLKMLAHYGGPAEVAADLRAEKRLAGWGRSLLVPAKISALLKSARETDGIPAGRFEAESIRECANEILETRRRKQRAKRELKRLNAGNAVLSRLGRAVGYATASVLWVYLGNPQNYHCGSAYRKAMGLNLKERSSGRTKGQLRITKRGPGVVRRWLYLASMRLLREEGVRVWFEAKKVRDGNRGGKALVGVMRKLAVALYRITKAEVEFEAGKLFPRKPLKQSRTSARARQKGTAPSRLRRHLVRGGSKAEATAKAEGARDDSHSG
jgi:transposase